MRYFAPFVIFLTILTSAAVSRGEDSVAPDTARAVEVALLRLEQLDAGSYDDVWEAGNPVFQVRHEKASWLRLQQVQRLSYGPLVSRQLKSVRFKPTYTANPDGHYVLVQFDSTFSRKQNAVETVILDAAEPQTWGIVEIFLN